MLSLCLCYVLKEDILQVRPWLHRRVEKPKHDYPAPSGFYRIIATNNSFCGIFFMTFSKQIERRVIESAWKVIVKLKLSGIVLFSLLLPI